MFVLVKLCSCTIVITFLSVRIIIVNIVLYHTIYHIYCKMFSDIFVIGFFFVK